jgi:hypothetical protein
MGCHRNKRCKLQGGLSTGPHAAEERERIAVAQRERWRKWRGLKILGMVREEADVSEGETALL